MKTLYKIGWNELINAAVNNGYELIDSVDGCSIDSVLYIKPDLLIFIVPVALEYVSNSPLISPLKVIFLPDSPFKFKTPIL